MRKIAGIDRELRRWERLARVLTSVSVWRAGRPGTTAFASYRRRLRIDRAYTIVESVGAAATIAAEVVATPWRRQERVRWGTFGDEAERDLPGDDLVVQPNWQYTHAVVIGAPPQQVWPWLVQIGQGRAGFYSYVGLENLLGCRVNNASRLLPAFQRLEVGGSIRLHPKAPLLPVQVVEPGRALVFGGMTGLHTGSSWAFVLVPDARESCRLLVRGRGAFGPAFRDRLFFGPALMEPVTFVMERKMLLTIKALAEASYEQVMAAA
jgi:hypothetical protein